MGILSDEQRSRFRELDRRNFEGALSADEQAELRGIEQEIEAAEAIYLAPALARLRAENQQTKERIAALETLAEREEAFQNRLKQFLDEATAERRAMQEQYERIMGSENPDSPAGASR